MPGPDFDPRGRANRALLVGVYHYEHTDDLFGVRHNLGEMFEALLNGGLFGTSEIDTISPARSSEFLSRLDQAAEQAHGLLLLYFSGHGRLSHDGSELFLTFGKSRRLPGDEPHYSESVSWNEVLLKLRGYALNKTVGRIVVVLDCCYAGNALQSFRAGALEAGRDRISVLTAVQVNRRIPAGQGHRMTPYTSALVGLMRGGLGDEDRLVRLAPLAAAVQEALRGLQTDDGDPWEPRHHLAEGGRDVIVGVAGGHGLREQAPGLLTRAAHAVRSAGRRLRDAAGDIVLPPAKSLIAVGTVCAVLLAAGGYGIHRWLGGHPACAPPVQLRLLTDPDTQPTVSRAVDAFLGSRDNHDGHGCRRAGISVEAPKADDAVTGFQHAAQWQSPQSTGSFQPQRDIGSQPDVWIPGSSVSYQRARAGGTGAGAATLQSLGPVAYSPLVLAVLRTFAVPAANVTGVPAAELVSQLGTSNKDPVVLRADPSYTDSAQLATVGLYGANKDEQPTRSGDVSRLEQQAALLSPAPRSSYELMCALASGPADLQNRAAVLMPEQVMAQFNDASGPLGETGCDTARLGQRSPEYPADVGMLDLPFVHVTWQDGTRDAAARGAAVQQLYSWLTGSDGQRLFTDAGYRGLTKDGGGPAAPAAGSWLTGPGLALGRLPLRGYDVSPASVDAALKQFRTARGSGQVLYLLDSSTSMGDAGNKVWSGPGRAKDLVAQSLDVFGPQDQYGVWTVSGTGPPYRRLVPLGPHASPDGPRQLLSAAATGGEAHPGDAVLAALAQLKSHQVAGRPQRIVVLTDDEDDTWISAGQLADLGKAAVAQHVPVDWVSLTSGGCTAGGRHRGPQIARATGGRCLDPGGNQESELHDEVAQVGTGDAQ